jgi:hypothetical protein
MTAFHLLFLRYSLVFIRLYTTFVWINFAEEVYLVECETCIAGVRRSSKGFLCDMIMDVMERLYPPLTFVLHGDDMMSSVIRTSMLG